MRKNRLNLIDKIALNSFGTIFYFVCQWLITVFVVRLSGYKDAGVLSLIISTTNIFYFIALFGVRNYQISDVTIKHSDSEYIYMRIITSAISFLLFEIIVNILNFDHYTLICSNIYIFYKIGEAFTDVIFGSFQRYDDYKSIAISYILKGSISLLVFICVMSISHSLFYSLLFDVICYYIVIIYFDFFHLKKNFTFKFKRYKIQKIFYICLPLMIYMLIVPYLNFISRYIVSINYNKTVLGGYSSITMVFTIASTLISSIYVSIIPKISIFYIEKKYQRAKSLIINISVLIFVLGFLGLIASTFIGEFIFEIIFGSKIAAYIYLLNPTIIASIVLCFTTFYSSLLIAFGRNKFVLLYNFIGAIICTITISPLISWFGLIGSLYCLFIGLFVSALLLICKSFNCLKDKN